MTLSEYLFPSGISPEDEIGLSIQGWSVTIITCSLRMSRYQQEVTMKTTAQGKDRVPGTSTNRAVITNLCAANISLPASDFRGPRFNFAFVERSEKQSPKSGC